MAHEQNFTEKQAARFWKRVAIKDPKECWPWIATLRKDGYGQFKANGHVYGAHRVAYALSIGKIPESLHVLHRCDNPTCCNPAHLWTGTNADNMKDRDSKGRRFKVENTPKSNLQHGWMKERPERIARGEAHGSSVLNEAKVREIRRMWAAKEKSVRAMSKMYGCSRRTIRCAAIGETWKHVE